MKTKVSLFTFIFFLTGLLVSAQENENKEYIWSYEGKKRSHTLGLYGGLYGSYSELNSDAVGFLGLKTAVVFDKKLGVGLAGFALWYDKALSDLSATGTYHLQAGYTGAYVEYIQPVGNRVKINFSILSGAGLVKYQIDKAYETDLPWYQRTIDQDNFSVFEPGMEIQTRLAGNWWFGIYATYRNTSPVKMQYTDEDLLKNYTTGLSIKYGIF